MDISLAFRKIIAPERGVSSMKEFKPLYRLISVR
jgi:hypothetical protein